jgi:hypothetical protein
VQSKLPSLVGALALGCNAILGISDTSLRGEAGSPGQGSGSASGAGATGGATGVGATCTTHAECLARSGEFDPSACIADHCVELLTPECPLVLPDTDRLWLENLRHSDPDPVIFGVFTDVPTGALVGIDARNYDLVLTEVTRAVGGIPAANGKRRPLLAVVCRNRYDSSEAFDRAIDHLTDELQVPGIIAGLEAGDVEYAFRRRGRTNHVFFMSPFDADRSLVELIDDGLVWEMLSGGEQLAPTYAPLLERALEHLRGNGRLGPDEPVRVALVTAENVRMLSSLSSALTGGILEFNGHPARENSAEYFRAVSIASSVLANEAPDYSQAIQVVRDFSPHVVIAAAATEFVTTIIPALEAGTPKIEPFYLLSPWHCRADLMTELLVQLPDIHSRLVGVNYAAAEDQTIYDAYQARFDAAFPLLAGTRGYENHYDAGYYLIHAAAAAGSVTPLIGSDLVNGMRRLLSGRLSFSVGPEDLLPAFLELETPGSSIVLNGAMGPPNFDPATGARDEPGSVWCVDAQRNVHADVLRLDADGDLVGDFPCFEFGEP